MSDDFQSEKGRRALFHAYLQSKIAEGKIDPNHSYECEERRCVLADWLRTLIADHLLDPEKRLPPYRSLAPRSLRLSVYDVTLVINQLRDERLLPHRKTRKDSSHFKWTNRDLFILEFIADMRAVRFDQVRWLAARESEYETGTLLSTSRTSELVSRYTRARLAVFMPAFANQPGFVYVTRRGLRLVDKTAYHADRPSVRLLEHLYWVIEVRLHLEDLYDDEHMEWTSERELQMEQELRQRGKKLQHLPDGILTRIDDEGHRTAIDIEVQLSKTSSEKIRAVMSDQFWEGGTNNHLWYYVSQEAQTRVLSAYNAMQRKGQAMRPSIHIIELGTWKELV